MARQVLITGGEGRLARHLKALLPDALACSHGALDVTDPIACIKAAASVAGGLIINCAAVLSIEAQAERKKAFRVNVDGARNMARAARKQGCRFVQISTDYVFGGIDCPESGYSESQQAPPATVYGLTKMFAESEVRAEFSRALVLRAPFRHGPPWPYDNAFVDQWCSARWIGEVAADIAEAALSDWTGILHIAGPRINLYEMASEVSPVRKSSRSEWPGLPLPMDTSLDSSRWMALKKESKAA